MTDVAVVVHLNNGGRIPTTVEFPDDYELEDVLYALESKIGTRGPTALRRIGNVLAHAGAISAVHLLDL